MFLKKMFIENLKISRARLYIERNDTLLSGMSIKLITIKLYKENLIIILILNLILK
jgi:hypothetical protein